MVRHLKYLLLAGLGVVTLGCGDSSRESPTSPSFGPSTTGCDLSTARGLVNTIFASAVRTQASGFLQTIQNAGAQSDDATDAGFNLFALLAANGTGLASSRSNFVNAIIPCQKVGDVALPIDFTAAFGANGAFEVRGSSDEKTAAVSHDNLWGLEPPLAGDPLTQQTWNAITTAVTSGVTTKRLLAYGYRITNPSFTNEVQVGTIFEWFTIPQLTFHPGVVVGTCFTDDATHSQYLIQHNAAGLGGEIVPSATPSFCGGSASSAGLNAGWTRFAFARRVLNLFRPQPLMASALGTRPPGGSVGALSPSVAVDPGQITLKFNGTVADGRTAPAEVKFTGNKDVSVTVTPTGTPNKPVTPMDGVSVRLIATTNLGATVTPTGNVAITQDGIATFPDLTINKAGGYRLIATIDGFGQNNAAGFKFNNITSNGFNLKQTK